MSKSLKEADVLALALGAARVRQLRYTRHSEERMEERNAQVEDVRRAIMSANSARWRPEHEAWHLSGGTDLDGDPLDVGVAIDGNTVRVCTLY